jgi:hypothetical protein
MGRSPEPPSPHPVPPHPLRPPLAPPGPPPATTPHGVAAPSGGNPDAALIAALLANVTRRR